MHLIQLNRLKFHLKTVTQPQPSFQYVKQAINNSIYPSTPSLLQPCKNKQTEKAKSIICFNTYLTKHNFWRLTEDG